MKPEAQRAIAAKGGRAAHQKGTAHEFTSEEARIAGRKGGEASRGGRKSGGNTNEASNDVGANTATDTGSESRDDSR
ncbi:MAG: general stress protein [Gemmatimonadota bacterium]|nr:general stress protein [Gemmatimonadota bacterium]